MKALLSTTAIVLGLSFPTLLLTQTTTATATTETSATGMTGFLTARGLSGLKAAELMGQAGWCGIAFSFSLVVSR